MSELTVPNPMPATLLVLPLEVIDAKDRLILTAATLVVSDVESLRAADAVHREMVALSRTVEEKRLEFGRQLDAVRSAVKAAAEEACEPLRLMQDDLGQRIKAYTDAEHVRYLEAKRQAAEDQARLQAEEDRRAQEAAELAADPGQPVSEVPIDMAMLPAHVPAAYVPPPPKSGAVRAKPPKLEIYDEALLPDRVNGMRLFKDPNLTLIKQLLAADPKCVPGARMVEDTGIAAKGSR